MTLPPYVIVSPPDRRDWDEYPYSDVYPMIIRASYIELSRSLSLR